MRVFLVRHGKIERRVGVSDPALTPLGVSQAQAAATYLQAQPICRIYSSPLLRAKETATYIAAAHKLAVIEDVRLRERANWGDLPDQPLADFVAMWERCNQDRDWLPPVGDSSRQAGVRVERFMVDRFQESPDDDLVAGSHGGTIADFILNIFPFAVQQALNPAFAAAPFSGEVMRECSITIVRYDGRAYNLEALALTDHLP
jgi:broad specificity phosphatase PhoE